MSGASLKQRLLEDIRSSMKAGDKPRVAALRLIAAAVKQREVDERIELDDEQMVATLDKMAKQRRESIEQFSQAGRDDLVAQETFELELIQAYLPAALEDEELATLIATAIGETGAASVRDMGKVMSWLRPRVQGRADMGAVSGLVKARLS